MTSPVHFALAFALGRGLQQALQLPLPEDPWQQAGYWLGTVLANLGLVLAICCIGLFWRRGTTLMPGGAPRSLVVRGPYRFSRNPMYLSLALSYFGLALILDTPWAWLTAVLPLALLQYAVIPHEEAQMQARFGPAYADYRQRVGRWWGRR